MPDSDAPPVREEDWSLLEDTVISKGGHASPDKGLCAMELLARIRGLKHSDQPNGVSSWLRGLTISLNDRLDDFERQKLKPALRHFPGSDENGDVADELRRRAALRWLANEVIPLMMREVGFTRQAVRMEAVVILDPPQPAFDEHVLAALEEVALKVRCARREPGTDRVLSGRPRKLSEQMPAVIFLKTVQNHVARNVSGAHSDKAVALLWAMTTGMARKLAATEGPGAPALEKVHDRGFELLGELGEIR